MLLAWVAVYASLNQLLLVSLDRLFIATKTVNGQLPIIEFDV